MPDGYTAPLVIILSTIILVLIRWLFWARKKQNVPIWQDILIIIIIIAIASTIFFSMGRTPTYKHGPIRIWSGNIWSDQNSQQIADPYTFTHLIHGVGLYAFFKLILPNYSLGLRAILAITTETAWEVFENTDMVINRYREETLSLDYYGDSIINSIFDILAATIAFFLTAKLPKRWIILSIVTIEILLLIFIRDNLTLNILMLIYPIEAIKNWQLQLMQTIKF